MMEKIECIRKSSNWTLIPRFFSRWRNPEGLSQQPDKAIEVLRAGYGIRLFFLSASPANPILFEQSRAGGVLRNFPL